MLVEVVQELGIKANGKHAELTIEEISTEYIDCYTINEYDGREYVECDPTSLVSYKYLTLNVVTILNSRP